MIQAAFRSCLIDLDIEIARRAWIAAFPYLPELGSDADVLIILHRARTEAMIVPFNLRAYSHRWLEERGFPSGLPDYLRPRAERIYPRIVDGVGISVSSISGRNSELAQEMRSAMSDAVEECYADGRTEPEFVRQRMTEARISVMRR